MHREAELKSAFLRELKRQAPSFDVFQIATAGWPDRGIVGRGRTSYWECKHGTPSFASHGLQELTCNRLAARDVICRYIVWQERGAEQQTLIVHPQAVRDRRGWHLEAEASASGFDHRWLAEQVRRRHE